MYIVHKLFKIWVRTADALLEAWEHCNEGFKLSF